MGFLKQLKRKATAKLWPATKTIGSAKRPSKRARKAAIDASRGVKPKPRRSR
jgi:hypothetical protein